MEEWNAKRSRDIGGFAYGCVIILALPWKGVEIILLKFSFLFFILSPQGPLHCY